MIVISFISNAQPTKIKYKQMESPATSSVNLGSQTFSVSNITGSVTLTGPISVSGTSTLTGAAKQTNTLNYEGNTTWNTNQTNTLTTGNTGTVAVLSDALFNVRLNTIGGNPADGLTYTFGGSPTGWLQTVGQGRVYLPYNATLVGWSATFQENGGAGTTEAATLNIVVNTTVTALSTAITLSGATGTFYDSYNATGLSQNVSAGDYITASLICPTWATNPTGVVTGITLWFVRRQ